MDAIECMWATLDGNSATVGRVVSGHDTEEAARLEADRIGGCYESADIVAAVQSGASYTDAVQRHAGSDRRPATVKLGGRLSAEGARFVFRHVSILSDLLMLALAESGNVKAQMWLVVTREIATIEADDYEWPESYSTVAARDAFIEGMYQALCAIEEAF